MLKYGRRQCERRQAMQKGIHDDRQCYDNARDGNRRRRISRLASVRAAARGRPRRAVRRQFLHRHQGQRRASARQPALRADAPRRHVSALRRSRRDLQPRLPGIADPLPVRPGADHQDQRARRDQHARPGQAREGEDPAGLAPARSTATRRCIRRPRTTGATSTRSACAPATTKASAAPKRCSSTITASTSCGIKVARIFNTYGPRMHPERRPRGLQFHRAGAAGRADHDLRRRRADALVLLRRRPGRRR